LRRLAREPIILAVLIAIVAIVAVFIIYPVASVMIESARSGDRWSLANYTKFITNRYFQQTLLNTLAVSGLSTIGGVLLGLVFAFALVRTNMPLKGFFMLMAILPLITPPFLGAFSFILLFGRMGLINQWLQSVFGFQFIIYGWHGVVLANIITFFPMAFLVLISNLSAIDPRLEEAAEDLGASFWRVLRTVTLPLLVPGIFSSAILVFMFNLSAFGTPALLEGGKLFYRGVSMLAPEAIIQILGMFDWGMGTTLAMAMLVPSVLLFVWQERYVSRRSFVTVTGMPSAFSDRPTPPAVKWSLFALCLGTSVVILAMYAVIVGAAFTRTWGVNYSFTWRHFETALGASRGSIQNSIVLSLAGALAAAGLGLLIGYMVVRKDFPGKKGLDFVSMLPYALPGIIFGLGFAVAFNRGLLVLTGTWAIIFLNHAIRRMPFALRSSVASLQQIDPSLEEASADLGASWPRTFFRITLPLLKPSLYAGITFSFIKTMTDITAVIFLVSPRWKLMSIDIYNYVMAGRLGVAAALSTIMVAVVLVILGIVWKVSGLGYKILKM
jgi:iron(III) transport system permease protein